ncbi:hypothetical protein CYMTET_8266, partial [Cymbomonas tetramitiformis]
METEFVAKCQESCGACFSNPPSPPAVPSGGAPNFDDFIPAPCEDEDLIGTGASETWRTYCGRPLGQPLLYMIQPGELCEVKAVGTFQKYQGGILSYRVTDGVGHLNAIVSGSELKMDLYDTLVDTDDVGVIASWLGLSLSHISQVVYTGGLDHLPDTCSGHGACVPNAFMDDLVCGCDIGYTGDTCELEAVYLTKHVGSSPEADLDKLLNLRQFVEIINDESATNGIYEVVAEIDAGIYTGEDNVGLDLFPANSELRVSLRGAPPTGSGRRSRRHLLQSSSEFVWDPDSELAKLPSDPLVNWDLPLPDPMSKADRLQYDDSVYPTESADWHPLPKTIFDCEFSGTIPFIAARGMAFFEMQDIKVQRCFAESGAGVLLITIEHVMLNRMIFKKNVVTYRGAGIDADNCKSVTIYNTLVLDNHVIDGPYPGNLEATKARALFKTAAGLRIRGGSVDFFNLLAEGNTCVHGEAGISLENLDVNNNLRHVEVRHNIAGMDCAGICVFKTETISMEHVISRDNVAKSNGGGMCVTYHSPNGAYDPYDMYRVVLSGNVVGGSGAGMQLTAVLMSTDENRNLIRGEAVHFVDGRVENNRAMSNGGGIAGLFSSFRMVNTVVSNNQARAGGGISMSSGYLWLNDVTVNGNIALSGSGGGVETISSNILIATSSTFENNSAHGHGGGVYAQDTNVNFKEVSAKKNSAVDGGAVQISGQSRVELAHLLLESNTASLRGGGAFLQSTSSINTTKVKVARNYADSGGGFFLSPNPQEESIISNVHFQENVALSNGGGLEIIGEEAQNLDLNLLRLQHNVAGSGGGGLFLNSDVQCTYCFFMRNTALYGESEGGPTMQLHLSEQ